MALDGREAGADARASPARRGAAVRRRRRAALVAAARPARACARASPTTASGSPTPPRTMSRRPATRRCSTSACRSSKARRSRPASTMPTSSPWPADETATLFEHCARGLDRSLAVGAHGLPLIGTGDWNDGMNRVGEEGKGESVWLGWFLHATLTAFAPLAEARGEPTRADGVARARRRAAATRSSATAGTATGTGAATSTTARRSAPQRASECRIDSIAQSWACISGRRRSGARGAGDGGGRQPPRAPRRRLALLFTPPFDQTAARSRLHQGLSARHPRERRPVHARRRLVGDRASPRSARATRPPSCSRC